MFSLGVLDFKKEFSKGDKIIIDIRTSSEIKNTGIIDKAIFYDFYSKDFLENINNLDKDKKYLIYCKSGNRTKTAVSWMKKLGFDNVFYLDGGIDSWINAGEKVYKQ